MNNLQDKCKIFGDFGCLAMDYIYAALYDKAAPEELQFLDIMTLSVLYSAFEDKTLLDDECTVQSASKLMKSVNGKDYKVTKKLITSLDDIPDDNKWRCIRKSYNGHSHWALWKGKKLIFNSLSHSQCYLFGTFDQVREIEV